MRWDDSVTGSSLGADGSAEGVDPCSSSPVLLSTNVQVAGVPPKLDSLNAQAAADSRASLRHSHAW